MLEGRKADFKKYAKQLESTLSALGSENKVRTLAQELEIHSAEVNIY